jgi:hypothetical protein
MVPLPEIIFNRIAFPLQMLASRVGEGVIAASGVPVLREGNVLMLPGRTLEVAEACSGIRSLITLLMLAIVVGYFTERRTSVRVLIVLAAVPIAVFANAARVAFSQRIREPAWRPTTSRGSTPRRGCWTRRCGLARSPGTCFAGGRRPPRLGPSQEGPGSGGRRRLRARDNAPAEPGVSLSSRPRARERAAIAPARRSRGPSNCVPISPGRRMRARRWRPRRDDDRLQITEDRGAQRSPRNCSASAR